MNHLKIAQNVLKVDQEFQTVIVPQDNTKKKIFLVEVVIGHAQNVLH